jgi:hypothetical protein
MQVSKFDQSRAAKAAPLQSKIKTSKQNQNRVLFGIAEAMP